MFLSLLAGALAAPLDPPLCVDFAVGPETVSVTNLPLTEPSGLTTGIVEPDVYYTLGDAGNAAELYLFRLDGLFLGTQVLSGATNTDWEDLGAGPCPSAVGDGTCLFVADIGDNDEERPYVTIWVVPETLDDQVTALGCDVAYPDGRPHDAESLAVDPDGGVRIFTKESNGATQVYRATGLACFGETQVLTEEADLDLDAPATGAAMRADGTALVVRANDRAWLWTGCTLDLGAPPVELSLPGEPLGEAVTFSADGLLVTTAEEASFTARIWPCSTQEDRACPSCGCAATGGPGAGVGATLLLALGLARGRGTPSPSRPGTPAPRSSRR